MKISGFTFMRNTSTLYYPFLESIQSILPILDEFVIAMGDNNPDDQTESLVRGLNSDKIKLIKTCWDLDTYKSGTIYAQQTDLAKEACTGDWLFYLQSDEVVHEDYLETVVTNCKNYLMDTSVEGFLFDYKHFWGDYNHYIQSHAWYPQEIRIIRNRKDIHSYGDAQSFKSIENFDYVNYRTKIGTRKLQVIKIPASIYHYGWVRPPESMQTKSKVMDGFYHDKQKVQASYNAKPVNFDYGNMSKLTCFKQSHPSVMLPFIEKFNWAEQLNYSKDYKPKRALLKHEKIKYRILSWIEQKLLGGKQLFGYSNWVILKNH
ncbi:MAG: hypothetical protein IPI45_09515 [Saprospiraceae bacterium]|nr:hypothetical protein [Saprospiraceae bacterium]MBK7737996.1 hypothetical protein [Saprospiraceae bacterium]MBK7913425.1 hypothetical protein [Saprospiraceae bacterium]